MRVSLADTKVPFVTDASNAYTAKITSVLSALLGAGSSEGSVDAAIYGNGRETDMEVTLIFAPYDGRLGIWGGPDNWCSRTDLLAAWAAEEADPSDPEDEDFVSAAIDDARSAIVDEIIAAVRESAARYC